MIKNIIFDLAGVLLNLNLDKDTEALHSIGLPDFVGCLNDKAIREPALAYLNGLMPRQEFLTAIRPLCAVGVTDEQILWAMDAVLDDIPESRLRMLVELRKTYRVFLLSNLYDTAWQYTQQIVEQQGYTLDECFEQTFVSYEMQLAKPDPRIYQQVIQQTGIIPAETLYYDDTRENIEAAMALGFQAILVPMNKLESVLLS